MKSIFFFILTFATAEFLYGMEDIQQKNWNQQVSSILQAATNNNLPEVLSLLAQNSRLANCTGPMDVTPLMCACRSGNLAVAKILVQVGAKTEVRDEFMRTALVHAAQENQKKIMLFLLNNETSINLEIHADEQIVESNSAFLNAGKKRKTQK